MPGPTKKPNNVPNEFRRITVNLDLDDKPRRARRGPWPLVLSSRNGRKLLERRHGLATRARGRPDSNSELPNVREHEVLDAAGAPGEPIELRVMEDHGNSVRRRADVALEKIRAGRNRSAEGSQRVLGKSPGCAAVSNDQRRIGVAA